MTSAVNEIQQLYVSTAGVSTYTWPILVEEVFDANISADVITAGLSPASTIDTPPSVWWPCLVTKPATNQQQLALQVTAARYPNPGYYYLWFWVQDVLEQFPERTVKVQLI